MSEIVRGFFRFDQAYKGPAGWVSQLDFGFVDPADPGIGGLLALFVFEPCGGNDGVICHMEMYSDAFAAFAQFPDVFAALALLGDVGLMWTIDEAVALLVSLGFAEFKLF